MKFSEVRTEAWRNVVTSTTKSGMLCALLVVLSGGLMALDALAVRSMIYQVRDFKAAGGSTLIINSADAIDGYACENLIHQPQVEAAGAIRRSQKSLQPQALPQTNIPLFNVTSGFTQIIAPDHSATTSLGLLLSASAAKELQVEQGSNFGVQGQTVVARGIYSFPADGRASTLEYAALAETPTANIFDSCWVRFSQITEGSYQILRTSLAIQAPADAQVSIAQLNAKFGDQPAALLLYPKRASRYSAVFGLGIGIVLGFFAIRRRRLELASALHAGVPKKALLLQLMLETSFWVCAAVAICLPVAYYIATISPEEIDAALLGSELRTLAAAVVGVFLGTASAAAILRESQLFAYFKDR